MSSARKSRAVKALIKQIARKDHQSLVVSELIEALMGVWGGPRQFAKDYHDEYLVGKPGGMVRQRQLDSIMRLFVAHTSSLKGRELPVEGMTDADLEAAALRIAGNVELDASGSDEVLPPEEKREAADSA